MNLFRKAAVFWVSYQDGWVPIFVQACHLEANHPLGYDRARECMIIDSGMQMA